MEKEFLPYEISLRMKAIGFDGPCFAFWEAEFSKPMKQIGKLDSNGNLLREKTYSTIITDYPEYVLAPLYQQAFSWFREKHGWIGSIWQCGINEEAITSFEYAIDKLNDLGVSQYRQNFPYKTYEEAELACLEGLIEIIEQEKK